MRYRYSPIGTPAWLRSCTGARPVAGANSGRPVAGSRGCAASAAAAAARASDRALSLCSLRFGPGSLVYGPDNCWPLRPPPAAPVRAGRGPPVPRTHAAPRHGPAAAPARLRPSRGAQRGRARPGARRGAAALSGARDCGRVHHQAQRRTAQGRRPGRHRGGAPRSGLHAAQGAPGPAWRPGAGHTGLPALPPVPAAAACGGPSSSKLANCQAIKRASS